MGEKQKFNPFASGCYEEEKAGKEEEEGIRHEEISTGQNNIHQHVTYGVSAGARVASKRTRDRTRRTTEVYHRVSVSASTVASLLLEYSSD